VMVKFGSFASSQKSIRRLHFLAKHFFAGKGVMTGFYAQMSFLFNSLFYCFHYLMDIWDFRLCNYSV
jgi:hypothetical protein